MAGSVGRGRARWSTALALLLASAPAFAEAPEPGSLPFGAATTTTATLAPSRPPAPPEAPGDPAWLTYHLAFRTLALGQRERAVEILDGLIRAHPGHPAGSEAREVLRRLRRDVLAPPPPLRAGRDVDPSGLARAELVVVQTLHGIGVGTEVCLIADCRDPRAFGALLTLGGGIGLAISIVVTADGITPGHTAALNTGTLWGAWQGGALIGVSRSDDEQVIGAGLLAGQLVGLGAGELIWRLTRASAGDVSLASSAGMWSGLFTLFIFAATEFDSQQEVVFGTLLAVSNAGLLGGILLTRLIPMERGRVLVIDGGGVVGGLLGAGTALLIGGDDIEPSLLFGLTSAGMAVGLGAATFLTRGWDVELPPVQVGLLPAPGGGAVVSLGGTW